MKQLKYYVLFLSLYPMSAMAYLDPGTTSGIVALSATLVAILFHYMKKIYFRILKQKTKTKNKND